MVELLRWSALFTHCHKFNYGVGMVTAILIMDVNDDLEVCELVLEVLTCYLLVQKITKYIKSKEFNYF